MMAQRFSRSARATLEPPSKAGRCIKAKYDGSAVRSDATEQVRTEAVYG